MATVIAAIFAWSVFGSPATGRYAVASDGQSVVRMDTATGRMEVCRVAAGRVVCEAATTAEAK